MSPVIVDLILDCILVARCVQRGKKVLTHSAVDTFFYLAMSTFYLIIMTLHRDIIFSRPSFRLVFIIITGGYGLP